MTVRLTSSLCSPLVILLAIACLSCKHDTTTTDKTSDSLLTAVPGDPKDATVEYVYYNDGKIHNALVTNSKTNHKLTREYFHNGQLFEEVLYVNNVREGISHRYFETGLPSQETPYKNNEIHGIQKRYRKSGLLMAEVPYFEGHVCAGLKEYSTDGTLKKRWAEIEITPIDNILRENEYILEIQMSDDSKGVEYYTGELGPEKYIRKENVKLWDTRDGKARIRYSVGRGDFRMEEVNIIAKMKTSQSNYYITTKKYHLAVENRF